MIAGNKIMQILEEITFGPYETEVFLRLRDSLFISTVLHDSEAWYNMTEQDVKTLEDCDLMVLRQYFSLHSKCAKELPHLELGALPLRFVIMQKRILYLNYLLNESEEALIHQFLISQWKSPVKGDWCTLVQKDLEDLDIELSLEEIRNTPKEELKIFLSEIVKEKAFQYLMEKKELHSKMKNLKYERLELQKYLKPDSQLTKTEINFTIAARGNMLRRLKQNFKSEHQNNLKCRLCFKKSSVEGQKHIFEECEILGANTLSINNEYYEELFSQEPRKVIYASRRLSHLHSKFITLLDNRTSDQPSNGSGLLYM